MMMQSTAEQCHLARSPVNRKQGIAEMAEGATCCFDPLCNVAYHIL